VETYEHIISIVVGLQAFIHNKNHFAECILQRSNETKTVSL